jgi:maleate isomerase
VIRGLPPLRARIGLIIPSSNRLTEPQFQRYAPSGVQIHVTRLRMTGPHHAALVDLLPRIEEAAGALADARCDVVVFHCTGTSMESGLAMERRVLETMRDAGAQRVASTASALVDACEALGARRLVLVSPYAAETNARESAFLAEAGLEVIRDRALNLPGSDAYVGAPADVWFDVTLGEADPRADAYLLSCTNIHSIGLIEDLEQRLGRPVITSNQATLWYGLRICGLADRVPGLGKLMQLDLPASAAA